MSKERNLVKKMQGSNEFFFEEVLGVTSLEGYQREKILRPIMEYSKTAIAACHSVGKTWSMARVALWFVSSFKNSIVITTAPTGRQVRKLLWGELHDAYNNSKYPLGGRLLSTELKINPKWYAIGFSPQKEAGGDDGAGQIGSSFQGFHADYVMIIFDEATGIPADIWTMAEGLTTSGKIVKWICIANPTTRACEFFKCFSDREWHKTRLTCFDSPNLKANGLHDIEDLKDEMARLRGMTDDEALAAMEAYEVVRPHLLTAKWTVSRALKWGLNNPLFQSKALGQFPDVDDNVIVQLSDVETAIARDDALDKTQVRTIGIDVARFGEDETCFTELIGTKQTKKKKLVKRATTEVTGEAINMIEDGFIGFTRVLVDATGIGAGVCDNLVERYERNPHVEVMEVHFGQACEDEEDRKRYINLKAKMFDLLGQDIRDKLDLLDDEEYLSELPTIRFKFNSHGKMQIESKEDYKKRTGRKSPDSSDSLALANLGRYMDAAIGSFVGMTGGSTLTDEVASHDTFTRTESRIKINNY